MLVVDDAQSCILTPVAFIRLASAVHTRRHKLPRRAALRTLATALATAGVEATLKFAPAMPRPAPSDAAQSRRGVQTHATPFKSYTEYMRTRRGRSQPLT